MTMHHYPRILTLLLSAALLLTLPACDSGDDDDGGGGGNGSGSGEFSATFGGALSGSFNGNAFFGVVEDQDIPGGRGFVLFLTDADLSSGAAQYGEYIYFVRLGDRPNEGMYPISGEGSDGDVAGTLIALYANIMDQSSITSLGSQSGTLTITSSSDSRVRGSFSFEAEGARVVGGEDETITATISGTFDAANLANGGLPFFGGF